MPKDHFQHCHVILAPAPCLRSVFLTTSLWLRSGVHQQRINPESLLLEAVKQVKVSDLEDDILELPEDDPAAANNQLVRG